MKEYIFVEVPLVGNTLTENHRIKQYKRVLKEKY